MREGRPLGVKLCRQRGHPPSGGSGDSDTLSLCVEDHIVVNLDLKSHTATATDFGKPIDIESINWQNIERKR